jgi:leucyl aminopeptidase
MNIAAIRTGPTETAADALVVGVFARGSNGGALGDAATQLDRAAGGLVGRLLEQQEFTGKVGETVVLWGIPGLQAGKVILTGLGPREQFHRGAAFRAAGAGALKAASRPLQRVAFFLGDTQSHHTEHGVAGALAGCTGQDLYRKEKKLHPPAEILWHSTDESAVQRGQILGEAVNFARRLVNEPPQYLYPETFAQECYNLAEDVGLQIEVWDEHRLAAERAGALLAVARGSARPPRLVILRHLGGARDAPPLALVGKGVTFDSGGLSLKPNESMLTMKCDMSGAAAVAGAMQAIARLKLPLNAIGLLGLVENMPGGRAMKLGDVLTARSGKTIEVLNTDAEGRLVLADVLHVAIENQAARIIDLATLTGSCVVALGQEVAGAMTNDQSWCDCILEAARDCGEPVWQLPMFEEYGEQIRGQVADIKNVGDGRWGGAITAAKFLEEFVEGRPWTHLDIAGPAFAEKPKPWIDAGASGVFVRTLVEIARRWK